MKNKSFYDDLLRYNRMYSENLIKIQNAINKHKMKSKLNKVYNDIMIDLYANANPPADFLKLVENAEVNEFGEKDIHYENYEIDSDLSAAIFNKHTKGLRPHEIEILQWNVWMGAAPKNKQPNSCKYVKRE